ncbi:hypothetical protein B0H65DRAFT_444345 [Neurospora tetraspora]|uniref:Uncharacterized protein n=1 Tax=Neurospora tetraspora TaxID=94610 RepID=A0AAE0JAZ8_9PEZI|nr:hypothetical protein B0H65DRAFT_444345 [Neurospora tetraspora]
MQSFTAKPRDIDVFCTLTRYRGVYRPVVSGLIIPVYRLTAHVPAPVSRAVYGQFPPHHHGWGEDENAPETESSMVPDMPSKAIDGYAVCEKSGKSNTHSYCLTLESSTTKDPFFYLAPNAEPRSTSMTATSQYPSSSAISVFGNRQMPTFMDEACWRLHSTPGRSKTSSSLPRNRVIPLEPDEPESTKRHGSRAPGRTLEVPRRLIETNSPPACLRHYTAHDRTWPSYVLVAIPGRGHHSYDLRTTPTSLTATYLYYSSNWKVLVVVQKLTCPSANGRLANMGPHVDDMVSV